MEAEKRGWELLASRDPREVCDRAGATYCAGEGYTLPVFGFPVVIDPAARTISGSCPEAELILTKVSYFSRLSILYYLVDAEKIAPTGRLVGPSELRAGQFFAGGSHRLPLDELAALFCKDPGSVLRQAARFGGGPRPYGDAAVELPVFPRVPVTLVFWEEDEEFPARAYLLFDDTCEEHLPADILWSVAMLCAIVLLRG